MYRNHLFTHSSAPVCVVIVPDGHNHSLVVAKVYSLRVFEKHAHVTVSGKGEINATSVNGSRTLVGLGGGTLHRVLCPHVLHQPLAALLSHVHVKATNQDDGVRYFGAHAHTFHSRVQLRGNGVTSEVRREVHGHHKDSVSGVGKGVQVFVRRRVSNGRGGNGMRYGVPIHVSNEINAAVFAVLAASSKVVLVDGVVGTIVTQTTTDTRADAAIEDEKRGLPLLSQFFAEGQVSLEEHVY